MTREFYLTSNRWKLSIPVVAALVALLTFVSFKVAEHGIDLDHEDALRQAAQITARKLDAATVNGPMMGAALLAATVDPALKRAASGRARDDDPAVIAWLTRFRTLFHAAETYVMDGQGRIVDYTTVGTAHGTGAQAGYRPYFKRAMQGQPNVYVNVGTNSSQAGLYFATPITRDSAPGGVPLGVLVAKLSLAGIGGLLADSGHPALLLSPQGVVFAATRDDWLFHVGGTVDDARVAAIRDSRQLGHMFDTTRPVSLPFDPAADRARIDGRDFSIAVAPVTWNDPGGAWTLVLVDDRGQWLSPSLRTEILAASGLVLGLLGLVTVLLLRAGAQRRAETERVRKLSRAVEHSPVGTVIADVKRRIQYVNPRFSEVAGYSAEEISGADLALLVDSEVQGRLERVLAEGRIWIGELVNRRKDGSPYWADWGIAPIRDAAGAVTHLVALVEDISERKELERQVADQNAALQGAHDEIQTLNRRLAAENLRLGAELDVSRRLQQMILPTEAELAEITGLDVAAFMEPASEVGGDYYDILQEGNGRIRFGIGDVTGHGLESGVVMLMTQSAVRTLVTGEEPDPLRLLDVLNHTIYKNVERMGSDKNLTLALLDYRPGPPEGGSDPAVAGHLRVSGQHESVIVVRHGGTVDLVDTVDLGLPIGLVREIKEFVAERTILLYSGDVVVLYTDGITEAADQGHTLYGLERLCEVVSAHWQDCAEAITAAVVADVRRHIGGQPLYDDLTLVVFKQG